MGEKYGQNVDPLTPDPTSKLPLAAGPSICHLSPVTRGGGGGVGREGGTMATGGPRGVMGRTIVGPHLLVLRIVGLGFLMLCLCCVSQ